MKTHQALSVYARNGLDASNIASKHSSVLRAKNKARLALHNSGVSKRDIAMFEHIHFGLPFNPSRITYSLKKTCFR